MVIINPWPNYPSPWESDPWDRTAPWTEPIITDRPIFVEKIESEIKEKHVKNVRKGIFIQFEDGTWTFIATDDECFEKIKKALEE